MDFLIPIKTIFIYNDESSPSLDLGELREYVGEKMGGIAVQARGDFFSHHAQDIPNLSHRLACLKVKDFSQPLGHSVPLPGEISFEKTLLDTPSKRLVGLLYDGLKMMTLHRDLIPALERHYQFIHLVFTPRLLGTYDSFKGYYHARVIICGYPTLISTSGLVEAPARPRQYYLSRRFQSSQTLKENYGDRVLEYDDPRLTEVAKGYVMQAVFYHLFQQPFCSKKTCRLYDAHWQEEMLKAQLEGEDFCAFHQELLHDYITHHVSPP